VSETSQNASRAAPSHRPVTAGATPWLLAWALGVGAVLAMLLLIRGALSVPSLIALVLIATPALIGAFQPQGKAGRTRFLAGWAVAAAGAAWISGGFSSPLALLCLTPTLGALFLDASAAEAAGAAVGAGALLTLGAFLMAPPPNAPGGEGELMGFLLMILSAGAVVAAFSPEARRRFASGSPAQAGRALFADPALAAAPPELAQKLQDAEAARQDAEAARARAEADAAARAMFLANMSHELRTPLNAIMGFSDMMRARMFGPLAAKYGEYADLIHESGEHLLDLINDILDMSKIEADRYALHPETFDARSPVNAALRLMRVQAENGGVHLRCILPTEPLMATADLRAFKQITLNLLSNAVKFTPPQGSVILRLAAISGKLELVVADTGIGIAPEDLKRLGRPFEQAGGARDRARGSGLGLALVAALARLHGGELTLESRLGDGTAATVRLPVLSQTTSEPPVDPDDVRANEGSLPARLDPSAGSAAAQGAVAPPSTREAAPGASAQERSSAKIVSLAAARLAPPPPRSER